MKKAIFFTSAILIFSVSLHAQDYEKSQNDTTKTQETHQHEDADQEGQTEKDTDEGKSPLFAPFSTFPNLHPLVVHFPVVLLLVAFLSQLAAFFLWKKELGWITLVLLAGAFAGALLASQVFHPHAHDLAPQAQKVLEAHESNALWTLWLSGIALLLKAVSQFFLKQNRWMEILVFLVITGSVVTVSLTGHLGSQLVFIEEVGPGGNYLEQH